MNRIMISTAQVHLEFFYLGQMVKILELQLEHR